MSLFTLLLCVKKSEREEKDKPFSLTLLTPIDNIVIDIIGPQLSCLPI